MAGTTKILPLQSLQFIKGEKGVWEDLSLYTLLQKDKAQGEGENNVSIREITAWSIDR